MGERILMTRWEGQEEWKEWKDGGKTDLNKWDIEKVYKAEYKVIEREE